MNTKTSCLLFVVAAAFAIAGGAHATPRSELETIGTEVDGLLAGGTLDAKPAKAVKKIQSTIVKALGVVAEDTLKLLKKASKVAKKMEAARKKGVDVSAWLNALDASAAVLFQADRDTAEGIVAILAVDAHRAKVNKYLGSGKKAGDLAAGLPIGAKRLKKLTAAVKSYAAARAKAEMYFEEEVASGDLAFAVVEILIDDKAVVDGMVLGPGEHVLTIRTNLPLAAAPDPEAVGLETGDEQFFGIPLAFPPDPDGGREASWVVVGPGPGTYTLVIRGEDDLSGQPLAEEGGLRLLESIRYQVTLAE